MEQKMGSSPILSIIHTVTFGPILRFNGGNNRYGLENGVRKQILKDNMVDVWRIL